MTGVCILSPQKGKLKEVFEQNPYMAEIYPQDESRTALEVFQVAEGTGEFFDLSVKPLVIQQEHCLHCGNCMAACPFGAVEKTGV